MGSLARNGLIALALLAGCDNKGDAIATAEQAEEKASVVTPSITVPDIVETKAIAEEAFVYGLPIVMN